MGVDALHMRVADSDDRAGDECSEPPGQRHPFASAERLSKAGLQRVRMPRGHRPRPLRSLGLSHQPDCIESEIEPLTTKVLDHDQPDPEMYDSTDQLAVGHLDLQLGSSSTEISQNGMQGLRGSGMLGNRCLDFFLVPTGFESGKTNLVLMAASIHASMIGIPGLGLISIHPKEMLTAVVYCSLLC